MSTRKVKWLYSTGLVAVVKYRDDRNIPQCIIIDEFHVSSKKDEFELDDEIIQTATPYGIDWEIVYPNGFVIASADLQEVLYEAGIYTLEDVLKGTPTISEALRGFISLNSAKLVRAVRHAVGG